jgi:hypothetical protein
VFHVKRAAFAGRPNHTNNQECGKKKLWQRHPEHGEQRSGHVEEEAGLTAE